MLVTVSSSGYGLTTGSYKADFLAITDRGKTIVSPHSDLGRISAIHDALFSNEIFSAFIGYFKQRGIPNDEIAQNYLRNTHRLSAEDATAFWQVIKYNMTEFGLVQEMSGRSIVLSREMAEERLGIDRQADRVKQVQQVPPETPLSPPGSSPNLDIMRVSTNSTPQFHFNIQIHLPESASPDTYDAIFRSIGTYLLGGAKE
jgi:hypothetical protein